MWKTKYTIVSEKEHYKVTYLIVSQLYKMYTYVSQNICVYIHAC